MGICIEGPVEYLKVAQPIHAVRHNGNVEVWDEDWELHYGNLPESATGEDADKLYLVWKRGYEVGMRVGANRAKYDIRRVLGLPE